MDATRFDDLTKALATATSRRAALKTIAATTIGGILGLAGMRTAFAACQAAGHACGGNKQCCSNVCCHGVCCRSGLHCGYGGICV